MQEKQYRGSRIAKVLGNPLNYSIVCYLLRNKEASPSLLSEVLNRNIKTVSTNLRILRISDIVRYRTAGGKILYRLKYPFQTKTLIESLEGIVGIMLKHK